MVVPVHGNAKTLVELERRLGESLTGIEHELIFVDDASQDGSLELLRKLAAANPRVGVLASPRNVGQSDAIALGLEAARGETIGVLDADLQDDPRVLVDLLRSLRTSGAQVVFAARTGRYASRGRWLSSKLFKHALRVASGLRLPRGAGLCFVISAEAGGGLLEQHVRGGYLLSAMARSRLRMHSLPAARSPADESRYTSGMRVRLAWTGLLDTMGLLSARDAGSAPKRYGRLGERSGG